MAGPPSQAGRFKPRKPAKKIRVGATTPAAAPQNAPPPRTARASGRGGLGRSGGGGRGGRGRGRVPTPHGAVFFTGNAPPTVAGSKKKPQVSAASSSAKRGPATMGTKASSKNLSKKESTGEIVIGQMDVGVGGEVANTAPVEECDQIRASSRRVKSEETVAETKTSKIQPTVDTYDSDSSEEESRATTNQPTMTVQPTELPFPVSLLPLGIGGGDKRAAMYFCQESQSPNHEKNEPVLADIQQDAPIVSPFVDWNDATLRQEESSDMFLFQFPTRLPEIISAGNAIPVPIKSEDPMSSLTPDAAQSMSGTVSTQATDTNCFDNSIARAPAGRLGKIVVYKSGKTELIMGGENGAPEVCRNLAM